MPRAPKVDKSAKEIAQSIERSYKASKARLEKALAELTPGCTAFVRCCEALEDCERRYRDERAKRGIDPTDIGLAARPAGFHFVCHISTGGSVHCTEVSQERLAEVLERRDKEYNTRMKKIMSDPERRRIVKELEEEFPSAQPQHSTKESDDDEN